MGWIECLEWHLGTGLAGTYLWHPASGISAVAPVLPVNGIRVGGGQAKRAGRRDSVRSRFFRPPIMRQFVPGRLAPIMGASELQDTGACHRTSKSVASFEFRVGWVNGGASCWRGQGRAKPGAANP